MTKEQRYARTDDYIEVLKKTWTSTAPFDHRGPYYEVRDSFSAVKPLQQPHLPVFFGGASDEAIRVAGKHANVYALFGETLAGVNETLSKVRASAAANGRQDEISFSLSLRPILGRTEEEAWNRAPAHFGESQRAPGTRHRQLVPRGQERVDRLTTPAEHRQWRRDSR